MKKLLILIALTAMLGSSAIPALARQPDPPSEPQAPPLVFALTGKITAIDPEARTLTVKVWSGNWVARVYKGQTLMLKATDTTRVLEKQEDCTVVPVTFDELAPGDRVSARGRLVGELWKLWRITILPAECCCQ
jgi:hypothetical protein